MAEVRELSRGGLLVDTPAGAVQYGAPAETIKDTMTREGGVPRFFVLSRALFDRRRGLSVADLEFPIYYNLFVKKRPLVVVGAPDLEARVLRAVRESLLGPETLELHGDVVDGAAPPDLAREYEHFRKGAQYRTGRLELHDAIDFRPLKGEVALDDGVVVREDGDGYALWWHGEPRARFPAHVPLPPPVERGEPQTPFVPPTFGVTTLGRSHGFDPDPHERTSGFVLWIGGRGIMVDPPVRSTEVLRACEIDPKLVDGVLLTHCHADHDAGTLQKALDQGRITLFTTPTIFASYRRKWSAISGIPEAELAKLFEFRPVQVGRPVDIKGATFLFRFTLHSIPTIAFQAHFKGRSFNYSSDTLNDPRAVEAMFRGGSMERERRDELVHFDWGHDIVFHESGVPPLHTPLEILQALPDEVKRRLYVLHITPHKLATSGLQMITPGRHGTLALPVDQSPEDRVLRALELLGHVRLFRDLPLAKAARLLGAAREVKVKAGERFISAGEKGGALYVVTGGKAAVVKDGREIKVYGLGDYIGETAVFLGRKRSADVVAVTDVELIVVDGEKAKEICEGTGVIELCRRHARVRDLDAWSLLEDTELFSGMTVTQKNSLETLLRPIAWKQGKVIVPASAKATEIVLLADGVARTTGAGAGATRKRGAVIGDPAALLAGQRHETGAVAESDGRGFRLSQRDLATFLDENPGLKVRMHPWAPPSYSSLETGSLLQLLEDYL